MFINNIIIFIYIFILSQTVQAKGVDQYILGPGDRIVITVYGESDLNLDVILTGSGVINYPFIGEVVVVGLTTDQLKKKIVLELKPDYLINPEVNIVILSFRKFYIYGEVSKPGGYDFQLGLTLRKAIAVAGGLTERASKSKMLVISDEISGTIERRSSMGGKINPGDSIYIKQSFF